MKIKRVTCYSNDSGNTLLSLCSGHVNGARVSSCHPFYYRRCRSYGQCLRFFSEGTYYSDRQLARLLHKSVSKLTYRDRSIKAEKFEQEAFRKCKRIIVKVIY